MKTFTLFTLLKNKTSRKIISTLVCYVFLSVGGNYVVAQNNLHVKLPYDPNNNPVIWVQLQQNPLDSLLWQKYVHKRWTEIPLKERLQIKLWIQEMWLSKLNGKDESLLATITGMPMKKEEIEGKTGDAKVNIRIETVETNSIINKSEKIVVDRKQENIKQETTTVIPVKEKEVVVASTKSLSKSQKINELLIKPEVKNFIKDLEESFLAESTEMEELKENLYENFFILEAVLADEFEVLGTEYIFYKQKYPKGNYSESRWMMEKEQELKKLKSQKLEEMKQAFLERQIN